MLVIDLLLSLAAGIASGNNIDPLVKADEGLMQCYEPNDSAKTCRSIASYQRNGNGTWANTAIILLSQSQPITLQTVTQVYVKAGAVCGYVRKEQVLNGKIQYAGQPIPDEKAATILAKVAEGMAPYLDREVCTEYVQVQDELIAKGKIEGGAAPLLPDQRVRWIRPSEGYHVAPAPVQGADRASGG